MDKKEKYSFALIPGIAYDKNKNGHAFVQIIDSKSYSTDYFYFDVNEFRYLEDKLEVRVGDSLFKKDGLSVNLENETSSIEGSLEFSEIQSFPKTLLRPNIMGPFSFVPNMECYHGVVNIHHKIKGSLKINGKLIDFSDGYGYIEKDWGRSFPKWYVWMQSNHFEKYDASLMFSIAKIPWLKRHFTGFISFLKVEEKLYLFSTYTNAKIKQLDYTNGTVNIVVQDRKYTLSIQGKYDQGGVLKAPKNGLMSRKISESITSVVKVVLKDRKGEIIFEDYGNRAGLEVVGKEMITNI